MYKRQDFSLELYEGKQISLNGIDTIVCRSDFAFHDTYDFIVEKHNSDALWGIFRSVGVMPVGSKALDLLRIEQGIPSYTRELTDSYNPLESGLRKYISFNKGCYIGQENTSRMKLGNKLRRRLFPLKTSNELKDGSEIFFKNKVIGKVMISKPKAFGLIKLYDPNIESFLNEDLKCNNSSVNLIRPYWFNQN